VPGIDLSGHMEAHRLWAEGKAVYVCLAPQAPQKVAVDGILAPQLMQNLVPPRVTEEGAGAAAPQFGQNFCCG
jgi:hypothetical protein